MPDPVREQAIAAAVLERGTPTGTVTAERQHGQALREKAQVESPRSVIQSLREQGEPITQKRITRKLDESFGTKRAEDGRMERNDVEVARFTEATASASLAKEFLDNRFDRLDSTKQTKVLEKLEDAIAAWPEGQDFLASLTSATDKRKAYENILNNPAFASKLRAELNKVLDQEVPNPVREAAEKFEEAEAAEKRKKKEIEDIDHEIDNDIDPILEQYNLGGQRRRALETTDVRGIETELRELEADRADKRDEIKALERRINAKRYKDPNADLTDLRAQLSAARREQNEINAEIQERQLHIDARKRIENEYGVLTQRKQELAKQKQKLEEELDKLKRESLSAKASLRTAELDRTAAEQDFADNLDAVFAGATMQYLIDEIEKYEIAENALVDEQKDKAKDHAEEVFWDQMKNRWDGARMARRLFGRQERVTTVPNKDRIKEDFGRLVTVGPDELVRTMILEGDSSIGGEVAAAKLRDPEFMNKARGQVAEAVIKRYMQLGERLTDDEVTRIFNSEWGQEAIQHAFDSNKALDDFRRDMRAKGVARNGTEFAELIKKNKDKLGILGLTGAGILMILFGLGAFPALGAVSLGTLLSSSISSSTAIGAAGGGALIGAGAMGVKQSMENN